MCLSACPAGQATWNWLMARKTLFSGLSQSMKWTVRPRPWSQPSTPSTTVPLSSSSVAAWLASSSLPVPRRCRAFTACMMRPSSSQGLPPLGISVQVDPVQGVLQVVEEQDLAEALPAGDGRVFEAAGVCSQPIRTSWSMKGCSTSVNSGPMVISLPGILAAVRMKRSIRPHRHDPQAQQGLLVLPGRFEAADIRQGPIDPSRNHPPVRNPALEAARLGEDAQQHPDLLFSSLRDVFVAQRIEDTLHLRRPRSAGSACPRIRRRIRRRHRTAPWRRRGPWRRHAGESRRSGPTCPLRPTRRHPRSACNGGCDGRGIGVRLLDPRPSSGSLSRVADLGGGSSSSKPKEPCAVSTIRKRTTRPRQSTASLRARRRPGWRQRYRLPR